jgi:hypothetical protein
MITYGSEPDIPSGCWYWASEADLFNRRIPNKCYYPHDDGTYDIYDSEVGKWLCESKRFGTTRTYKVYGKEGCRQKESFEKSYKMDFSEGFNTRVIEVLNADKTGTNEYSIINITRNTPKECKEELLYQLSDGIFKNSEVGSAREVFLKRYYIENLKNFEHTPNFELKYGEILYVYSAEFIGYFETIEEVVKFAYEKNNYDGAIVSFNMKFDGKYNDI